MSIDQAFSSLANHGARWIFWLLVALSVLALAIAVDRIVLLVASRDDAGRLRSDLLEALRRGAPARAMEALRRSASFEAKVLLAGLSSEEAGPAVAEERMASASQFAKLTMERNLSVLATVGTNAPFVGLLGTVIGIIRAFRTLDAAGGRVSAHLLSDIGEALVATGVGLLVALPAIAFYNTFQRVISARIARADALGREVLAFLKTDPAVFAASRKGA